MQDIGYFPEILTKKVPCKKSPMRQASANLLRKRILHKVGGVEHNMPKI